MSPPSPTDETWTTGALARLAGVTVRTLHHYDAVGLLHPSRRTDTGYRLYGRAELERLQLVLLYRNAGVPLHDIRPLLDDPAFDRVAALQTHLARLDAELARTRTLRDALATLLDQELAMTTEEPHAHTLFHGFEPDVHAPEATERWGDTRAWKVSHRRTRNRSPEAWARYAAAQEALEADLAAALAGGASPESDVAMGLAEQHRQLIDDWFYPCSYDAHMGLADMYVADPRFAAHYETRQPGLARFIADAIFANATARA